MPSLFHVNVPEKHMNFVRIYLATALTAALLSGHPGMAAELELANLFSDHLVLQREREVPVWGWAEPGEAVTVAFGDQRKAATADATGKWRVNLDPMPASAVPRQLTATSSKSRVGVTVENVLVGEVWLGSGQSNMAMQMSGCRDFAEEQRTAQWPQIRMFTDRSGPAIEPQSNTKGNWVVCSPKTVGSFSGTLYCFGREIHRELNVPVGLINSSVGGTPIESWMPVEVQTQVPELRARHEALLREWQTFDVAAAGKEHENAMVQWEKDVAAATKAGTPPPRRPYPGALRQHQRQGAPGGLFNGKIAPLVPCALRGILWYQGEHNAYWETAGLYQHQLPLLVQSWRERWGTELPFAWVQLPNLARGQEWALVREGMLKTLRLPETGMAVTIDIGEAHNIHPRNKQDVGKRLALWALGEVYGREVPATSGPLPGGFEIRGAEVVLSFTHTDGGLRAKGGELTGFMLAGADRQWLPAWARIEDNQVVVSHPEVESPVAVRYAFDGDPQCNLINGAGLPASPFRTDDWPVTAARTAAGPKIPASSRAKASGSAEL